MIEIFLFKEQIFFFYFLINLTTLLRYMLTYDSYRVTIILFSSLYINNRYLFMRYASISEREKKNEKIFLSSFMWWCIYTTCVFVIQRINLQTNYTKKLYKFFLWIFKYFIQWFFFLFKSYWLNIFFTGISAIKKLFTCCIRFMYNITSFLYNNISNLLIANYFHFIFTIDSWWSNLKLIKIVYNDSYYKYW